MSGSHFQIVEMMRYIAPGSYIAGGYCRWMVSDGKFSPGDCDIWSKSPRDFASTLSKLESRWGKGDEKSYSWDFHDIAPVTVSVIKAIDIPGRFMFGYPHIVTGRFDFTFLRGYSVDGLSVRFDDKADLEDAKNNVVRLAHITSVKGNWKRLMKYAAKGFDIGVDQFKVLADWYDKNGDSAPDTGDNTGVRDD